MAEIAGLKLIVPSSVAGSGVSVSASGKVTFTAATSVSVNGVFDSTYDNYLVVGSGTSSGGVVVLYRLRASGSDASAANYTWQDIDARSTTVDAQRSSGETSARAFIFRSTPLNGFHLYIYGPALAQPTAARSVNVDADSGARIVDFASTHSLSTAYDGITLLSGGATTLTGSLTVYGLSQ